MTELVPYIGKRVHLHVGRVCATGVLGLDSGRLTLSTLRGYALPIDGWSAIRPEPDELPDVPDLVLLDDTDRMAQIWCARPQPDWCDYVNECRAAAA